MRQSSYLLHLMGSHCAAQEIIGADQAVAFEHK
jgi:hypothetical protein